MNTPKHLLKKLCLSLCTCLVMLLCLELGFRIVKPQPLKSPWNLHPVFGAFHLPDETIPVSEPEFRHTLQSNKDGFIDYDHELQKPAGAIRIAMLGDSFIEGIQVAFEQNICRQLEQQLRSRHPQNAWEVMNFGVAGAGTAIEYEIYEKSIRRYSPDIVVLCFMLSNDVMNNHPLLEPKSDKLFLHVVDGVVETWTVTGPEQKNDLSFDPIPSVFRRYSHLARFAYQRILKAKTVKVNLLSSEVPQELGVFISPIPPLWEEAWSVTGDLIQALNHRCLQDQTKYVIVAVPDRIQVYQNWFEELLDIYPGLRKLDLELRLPNKQLQVICHQNAIPYLDLLTTFTRSPSKDPLYFKKDGHWNNNGHALAAETVAEFLTEQQL